MNNNKTINLTGYLVVLEKMGGVDLIDKCGRAVKKNTKKSTEKDFKQDSQQVKLYAYAKNNYTDAEEMATDVIRKQAFKGGVTRERYYAISRLLTTKIKNFIAVDTIEEDEVEKLKLRAKRFKDIGEKDAFYAIADEILKKYVPDEEADWFLLKAQFDKAKYFDLIEDKANGLKSCDDLLDSAEFNYKIHDALNALKIGYEKLMRGTWNSMKLKEDYKKNLNTYCNNIDSEVKKVPIVNLYIQSVQTFISKDKNDYTRLKLDYFKHFDELRGGKTTILNWIITNLIQMSYPDKTQELCLLYQWTLQNKLLITNGKINPKHFDNAVQFFCKTGNYKDADTFKTDYKAYVSDETYAQTRFFYDRFIQFKQGDYENLLTALGEYKVRDLVSFHRVFSFELKATFELKVKKQHDQNALEDVIKRYRSALGGKILKAKLGPAGLERLRNCMNILIKISDALVVKKYSKTYLAKKIISFEGNVFDLDYLDRLIDELK